MVMVRAFHDDDCPLGENGMRAYQEAREAFASTPSEALSNVEDRIDLAIAEAELESKQVCTCGLDKVKFCFG